MSTTENDRKIEVIAGTTALGASLPQLVATSEGQLDIVESNSIEPTRHLEMKEAIQEGEAQHAEQAMKEDPHIDVMEVLRNTRDLLTKGWHEEAVKYIEDILDFDPNLGVRMSPLAHIGAFESAFMTAARKHNVIAAFVVIERTLDPVSNKELYKMYTGGNHIADSILSYHLRPLITTLAQGKLANQVNPPKPYLEIGDLKRRKAF